MTSEQGSRAGVRGMEERLWGRGKPRWCALRALRAHGPQQVWSVVGLGSYVLGKAAHPTVDLRATITTKITSCSVSTSFGACGPPMERSLLPPWPRGRARRALVCLFVSVRGPR